MLKFSYLREVINSCSESDNNPILSLPSELTESDGKLFDNKSLEGKPLVINLFASWCDPCKREISEIEKIHKKLNVKEHIKMKFDSKVVDFEVTLIRAPKVIEIGDETQVLLDINGSPIAIYNGMHMGLSFHPELNGVTLFHDSLFRGSVNSNFQASGNINAA